jgi:hypothetical protein
VVFFKTRRINVMMKNVIKLSVVALLMVWSQYSQSAAEQLVIFHTAFKTYPAHVSDFSTANLKAVISEKIGVPAEAITLLLEGKKMDDSASSETNKPKVEKANGMFVIIKPEQLHLVIFNTLEKRYTAHVSDLSTKNLKAVISEKIGVPAEAITLLLEGTKMDDANTSAINKPIIEKANGITVLTSSSS